MGYTKTWIVNYCTLVSALNDIQEKVHNGELNNYMGFLILSELIRNKKFHENLRFNFSEIKLNVLSDKF